MWSNEVESLGSSPQVNHKQWLEHGPAGGCALFISFCLPTSRLCVRALCLCDCQVKPTSDGTSVDLLEEASNAKLDAWFKQHGQHSLVVATGFIAKNQECVALACVRACLWG